MSFHKRDFLTYKPAIITFLHHLHYVSLSELQLICILWFVVVNGFVSKIERDEQNKSIVTTSNSPGFQQTDSWTYGWRCATIELLLFGACVCGRELTCGLDGAAWFEIAP